MSIAASVQELIDDLPEQIALLDESCTIVAANRAWTDAVQQHGYTDVMPGHDYRAFCAMRAAEGYEPAVEALRALDGITSGTRSYWQFIYNGRDRWAGRDYQIIFHRIGEGPSSLISVTRVDLTEIEELRREKVDLQMSLSKIQALERQRMARELHDSTGQLITGMSLALARLEHDLTDPKCLSLVNELQSLVSEALQEIRLISYIAHPPALDRAGLVEALKLLVEGIGRRTSLPIAFETRGKVGLLPASVEATLYRVAQEALSNVHRHAHASKARVVLALRPTVVHLMIADDGTGMASPVGTGQVATGVGMSSMKARLGEIGGRLSIVRRSPGTAVVASVPLPHQEFTISHVPSMDLSAS